MQNHAVDTVITLYIGNRDSVVYYAYYYTYSIFLRILQLLEFLQCLLLLLALLLQKISAESKDVKACGLGFRDWNSMEELQERLPYRLSKSYMGLLCGFTIALTRVIRVTMLWGS